MSDGESDPDWTARRERMVDHLISRGRIERESTERALRAVPRHEFVPEPRRGAAYEDRPLPIGEGQTISAPHMVAVMCDRLELDAGERVLEVGTGCGYHAAVTAEIVGPGNVYTVEFHEDLAREADARLSRLGYDVDVRAGDGREGWPEAAPFDAAYLTCAAPEFPRRVVEQVRPGGRLLAPLGDRRQVLVAAWKRADGSLDREEHGAVRFVPLLGDS
ncbi:protein-L-isoaspartate(D-aspartate) O-methyltransferase [Salinirubellus sp. GCM10025818]|uniref:protein-L-isoaspartate(D-aspartate) O-methyltransferase n=1 Tax=Salinirubellus TaxID=2162630 RepID=UPI0030CB70D5